MSVHRIRLLGPWEFSWEETTAGAPPPVTAGTTAMPSDWRSLFEAAAGTALFRRRFHCPSNLGPHERVWLVCTGVRGRGTILFNDEPRASFASDGGAVECDLTAHLKPFNVVGLRVSVAPTETDASPCGLFEPVVLEIRSG